MTIKQALNTSFKAFESHSNTPDLDSEVLLQFVLKQTKEYLYTYPNTNISNEEYKKLFEYLEKIKKQYPLAYITNSRHFYKDIFFVNESTLIPRPETEMLVELTLNTLNRNNSSPIKILEVGTGSGCIAISILKYGPTNLSIKAIDISKQALNIAQKNIDNLLSSDLSNRIKIENKDILSTSINEKFDIFVSNPPYITTYEYINLNQNVRYEPKNALLGGDSGLIFYHKIAQILSDQLNPNGAAFIEINENLADETKAIFAKAMNPSQLEIHTDLAGKQRVLSIYK